MTKAEAIDLWFAFERELEDPAPLLTDKLLREAVGKLYALVPSIVPFAPDHWSLEAARTSAANPCYTR